MNPWTASARYFLCHKSMNYWKLLKSIAKKSLVLKAESMIFFFFKLGFWLCVYSGGNSYLIPCWISKEMNGHTIPAVKHWSGFVVLWAWFSARNTGRLHYIESAIDGGMYRKVLDVNLLLSDRTLKMGLPAWQWPKTPATKEWHIKAMEFPSESSDLGPVKICEGSWSLELPSSSQET